LREASYLSKEQIQAKIGLAASRIAISGNYMLRRSKHSKNEVLAPEEEGEEE
jgi:hypothetical protein